MKCQECKKKIKELLKHFSVTEQETWDVALCEKCYLKLIQSALHGLCNYEQVK